jgi:hypothetical protein
MTSPRMSELYRPEDKLGLILDGAEKHHLVICRQHYRQRPQSSGQTSVLRGGTWPQSDDVCAGNPVDLVDRTELRNAMTKGDDMPPLKMSVHIRAVLDELEKIRPMDADDRISKLRIVPIIHGHQERQTDRGSALS